MKWVLKTCTIIVGSDDRSDVFRSFEECSLPAKKQISDTIDGQQVFTLLITNSEGRDALKAGVYPETGFRFRKSSRRRQSQRFLPLPRWQLAGLALASGLAAAVGLLVWAMHGG